MPKIFLTLAILLSLGSWFISYKLGYVLTYNDGASHLNIARRIFDNLTPGLTQIGTVWLPLPHLLMLPFAINDFLWHTAIAGSIVSMTAFVVSVVFMYKIVFLVTKKKIPALLGAAILALNPNFLYLQTTPMTEPLLIATSTIAVYYLAKYVETNKITDLNATGIAVTAASLTRYDGWFLFVCLLFLIPLRNVLTFGWKKAEGSIFLFLMIGGLGIALWLLWNQTIFSDALYFIRGPYSAAAQQTVLENVGQLPTKHNLPYSLLVFCWAIVDNTGMFLSVLAVCSLAIVPFILKNKQHLLTLAAILSPFFFNLIALYFGQSAMNVPQAPINPGLFNTRYGLLLLPAIAFLLGVISSYRKLYFATVAIFILQIAIFLKSGEPIILTDGLQGLKNTYYTIEASSWLKKNYQGGLILTSLASHDAFVARAGIPMRNYIHEGTRQYWTNALKSPTSSANYITVLSFPPDSVYRSLKNNPEFKNGYTLVHNYEKFEIYKRK